MSKRIQLQSTITCPNCGYRKEETMPTNACQYFYECDNCHQILKPKTGDCCVYCSFGTVTCPPIQKNKNNSCCSNDNKLSVDNIIITDSFKISVKGSNRYSSDSQNNNKLKKHWDKVYLNSPENKLGWYETDLNPMLRLISKTDLNKSSRILNVGAGSTTLVDELLKKGYTNIIATDISEIALKKLENRVGNDKVEFIIDDLTNPTKLKRIKLVDIWIDRAVLHFFTKDTEQKMYFDLLKSQVLDSGYVIFAEFNVNGAERCSGLPVHRYSQEMLADKLGKDFELVDCFNYNYIMPSGAERPYIYALYKRINNK